MRYLIELNNLNNEIQLKAICSLENSTFSAGPGSGKTKTVVLKAAYLLNEIIKPPQKLACITYSNNAVREFKNRLFDLDPNILKSAFLGTVHSFCLSEILFKFGRLIDDLFIDNETRIADANAREKALDEAFEEQGLEKDANIYAFNSIRIGYLNNNKNVETINNPLIKVIKGYERRLKENNLLDYDDIIYYSRWIIENNSFAIKSLSAKFPWIIVDEYQDLGYSLHKIIITLIENTDIKIFAVGDPDQSIYGFGGANPTFFNDLMKRDDVVSYRSQINYRCSQPIIDASLTILKPSVPYSFRAINPSKSKASINVKEFPKGFESQIDHMCDTLIPEFINQGYDYGDVAILTSFNNKVDQIYTKLKKSNIPAIVVRKTNYDITFITAWIEDFAEWCIGGWRDKSATILRIFDSWYNYNESNLNIYKKGNYLVEYELFFKMSEDLKGRNISLRDWFSIVDKQLEITSKFKINKNRDGLKYHSQSLQAFLHEVYETDYGLQPLIEYQGLGFVKENVMLMTLHSAKGLQFKKVIMVDLEEGVLPSWKTNDLNEDRRLFYVGLTRTIEELYLFWSGFSLNQWGRKFNNGKTRFISEIEKSHPCNYLK
jgi:DNA helicase II / ATP-dependent DNA helicase PcrA